MVFRSGEHLSTSCVRVFSIPFSLPLEQLGGGKQSQPTLSYTPGFHSTTVFPAGDIYLINRDIGKPVEPGRREMATQNVERRERDGSAGHWQERELQRRGGAQVAHTWCTVVREVRFLSTSLQFYRSGRVSLCLYIYIQGDPRNSEISREGGSLVGFEPQKRTSVFRHCIEMKFYKLLIISPFFISTRRREILEKMN